MIKFYLLATKLKQNKSNINLQTFNFNNIVITMAASKDISRIFC